MGEAPDLGGPQDLGDEPGTGGPSYLGGTPGIGDPPYLGGAQDIARTFAGWAARADGVAAGHAALVPRARPASEEPGAAPAARPAFPSPGSLRIGLVLAGGGAKGAYELGVCDYLAEMGLEIAAIAGTSIGALNGAVLVGAPDLRTGTRRLAGFWERFSTRSGVTPFADQGLPLDAAGAAAEGTARQARLLAPRLLGLRRRVGLLEELVGEAVDAAAIRAGRPLWVAAYPLVRTPALPVRMRHLVEVLRWLGGAKGAILRLNGYPEHQIREAVLASAALPLIFPSRVVDGCAYLDGGLGGPGDRTPVRAFAEQEHCEVVVVVHLHPDAVVSSHPAGPVTRIDIRPSVPIVPPGPLGPLTGLLSFSPDRVQALRRLGYRDAWVRFEELRHLLGVHNSLSQAETRMLAVFQRLCDTPRPAAPS
ncbi:patatin-like phospholipase family protein [Streptomyces roseoverticillatus]|uniref:patatin-like phospholipase family protein n=1 Tax=Streptomyces roseoverticillatus TaxID=66429 RepID=UPI0034080AE0